VLGIGVVGRMHGHRLRARFLGGTQDARVDFAAIGDQDLLEHQKSPYSVTTSGSPYSTGWASSTRMRVTVPERCAGIWFMVFIASMMRTVWPSDTLVPRSTKAGLPGSGER